MKIYAHYGHKEFILCLGYKGESIKDYFRNYRNTSDVTLRLGRSPKISYLSQHDEEDWTVTLLDTGQETQTGGRLRRALPHIDTDTFLFTYGDGLIDSRISESIDFHRRHGAMATVTAVKPSGRFGELALDGQTMPAHSREARAVESAYVSGGFFVFQRELLDLYLDDEPGLFLEHQPLQQLRPRRPARGLPARGLLDGGGHLPRLPPAQYAVGLGEPAREGVERLTGPATAASMRGWRSPNQDAGTARISARVGAAPNRAARGSDRNVARGCGDPVVPGQRPVELGAVGSVMLVADVRPVAQDLEPEPTAGRGQHLAVISIVEADVLPPAAEGHRPRPEVDDDREHVTASATDDLALAELSTEVEPAERSVTRPGLVLLDERRRVDPVTSQDLGRTSCARRSRASTGSGQARSRARR